MTRVTRSHALHMATLTAALLLGTAASPPSAAYIISGYPSEQRPANANTKPHRLSAMDITAAPMPDSDIRAPSPGRPISGQASVSPSLFSPRNAYHGEGYVPGSTAQTEQEKRVRPAPGINLSVPLQ